MSREPLFERLQKTRLHEEIVDRLKSRILRGELVPGAKLPSERELAEQLGVNRTTVREALHKLESLDLVEMQHGRGVFVRDYRDGRSLELAEHLLFDEGVLRLSVLRDLAELRRILLPELAARAATNRSEADLEALERVVSGAEDLPLEERDWRVHNLLARASGNVLAVILLNAFTRLAREAAHLYFASEENRRRSRRFHEDIYRAIEQREAEAARRIMHDVLVHAEQVALGTPGADDVPDVPEVASRKPRRSPRKKEKSP